MCDAQTTFTNWKTNKQTCEAKTTPSHVTACVIKMKFRYINVEQMLNHQTKKNPNAYKVQLTHLPTRKVVYCNRLQLLFQVQVSLSAVCVQVFLCSVVASSTSWISGCVTASVSHRISVISTRWLSTCAAVSLSFARLCASVAVCSGSVHGWEA